VLPLLSQSVGESSCCGSFKTIDIYKTFHPKTKEYTFFSAPHRTFSKIGHIIGHKTSLNRYKKIKITPCILSDHHRLR
jgi:exonuclease III